VAKNDGAGAEREAGGRGQKGFFKVFFLKTKPSKVQIFRFLVFFAKKNFKNPDFTLT